MEDLVAPAPALAPAFDLTLERGAPIVVGLTGTGGRRSYVPALGGRFSGEGIAGAVVAGGETLLERYDGVIEIEASLFIECSGGDAVRLFGKGYRTAGGEFAGTRMTLMFEADKEGPMAHLANVAFVSEELPGADGIFVARII